MDPKLQRSPDERPRSGLLDRLLDLLTGEQSEPKNLDGSFLAVDRTRLAHERTMMAWIRTGLSLISFGFTIYKFFQLQEGGRLFHEGLIGPRGFGSMMIVTGICAVFLASLQHRREMQSLRAAGVEVPASLATIVGVLVSILGLTALLLVVFKQ